MDTKDIKGTGTSAAILVVKAGPLHNGVGECNIFASNLRYYHLDRCTTWQAKNYLVVRLRGWWLLTHTLPRDLY